MEKYKNEMKFHNNKYVTTRTRIIVTHSLRRAQASKEDPEF